MSSVVLTPPAGWQLPSAGFSSPQYVSVIAGGADASASTGFDISSAETVAIAFDGTYAGLTVVHEQTIDPTGASGWFPVSGVEADSPSTGGTGLGASGVCYLFPALGARHRMRATALASGTVVARIILLPSTAAVTLAGGAAVTGKLRVASSVTPTITAASAYALGDVIGTKMSFTSAVRSGILTGEVDKVLIQCLSNQTAPMDLILFGADPSASTFTNKAALAVNSADVSKIVGVVHLSDWTSCGTPSLGQAPGQSLGIKLTTTTLIGVLVSRGTPTFTGTSDVTVLVQTNED